MKVDKNLLKKIFSIGVLIGIVLGIIIYIEKIAQPESKIYLVTFSPILFILIKNIFSSPKEEFRL
ncbi:hypothetical protein BC781_102914 [Sediminitomix flava]|uniref:Uncharacterized protein n=1 Tax=Sediminitomix flava TaxID=379075 RepID=A0A316A121_SEDFL|nr:hypothetical protein BC781_102914 [Sediminitomix flava]